MLPNLQAQTINAVNCRPSQFRGRIPSEERGEKPISACLSSSPLILDFMSEPSSCSHDQVSHAQFCTIDHILAEAS